MPLLWLATLAVPSASSSTSPASTILSALSTRPLHSGSFALALSAISATACRQACRVVVSKPGVLASSQLIVRTATIVIALSHPKGRCHNLAARCLQHLVAELGSSDAFFLVCARPVGVLALLPSSWLPSWEFSFARQRIALLLGSIHHP